MNYRNNTATLSAFLRNEIENKHYFINSKNHNAYGE